jgi:hypothetical protein
MKGSVRDCKRDLEILFLRNVKEWTFTRIAQKYDITKGRARQLYVRMVSERDRANTQMGIGA